MRRAATPFDNSILRHLAGKDEICSASTIDWAVQESVTPFVQDRQFFMHIDMHPIAGLHEKVGEAAERCFQSQGLSVIFKKPDVNESFGRKMLHFQFTEEVTPSMRQKLTQVIKAICYKADYFHRQYENNRQR